MSDVDRIRMAAADLRSAFAELRADLAVERAALDAAMAEPILSEQEKRELQETAQRGDMGPEMREFAEEVRRGNADWEDFVRGRDEHSGLLEELVTTAQERFGDEAVQAMEDFEPPEDEPDPRPAHD